MTQTLREILFKGLVLMLQWHMHIWLGLGVLRLFHEHEAILNVILYYTQQLDNHTVCRYEKHPSSNEISEIQENTL